MLRSGHCDVHNIHCAVLLEILFIVFKMITSVKQQKTLTYFLCFLCFGKYLDINLRHLHFVLDYHICI